ncbi:mannose-1-phosphate guanylyltransferase [Moraxella caviae]|uniref:Cupin domain n=1 Tax=Moraxella caviae TaxID=34060 RepID=A0A1T0A1R6_9GAMM|nr:cupin domain-containing protein [Moraxella caviae]OOR89598.1 mannose-1-phosphate guanylyltransferase [Moraxella caviae]STZ10282.1 Cupin domain [Moraxella caviae]
MSMPSILNFADYLQSSPTDSVRTVIHQSAEHNLVLWQIPPNAKLPTHRHPQGQDIWVVMQGSALLLEQADLASTKNNARRIHAGQAIVIDTQQIHGVYNDGAQDCVLVSIIHPNAAFVAV